MEEEGNVPLQKSLQAARSLLDLVHRLSATTYDPSLLPRAIIPLWENAAGVFGLCYRQALLSGNTQEAAMYRSEIEVFRYVSSFRFNNRLTHWRRNVIGRIGERFLLAYKDAEKMGRGIKNIERLGAQRDPPSGTPASRQGQMSWAKDIKKFSLF